VDIVLARGAGGTACDVGKLEVKLFAWLQNESDEKLCACDVPPFTSPHTALHLLQTLPLVARLQDAVQSRHNTISVESFFVGDRGFGEPRRPVSGKRFGCLITSRRNVTRL